MVNMVQIGGIGEPVSERNDILITKQSTYPVSESKLISKQYPLV